MEIGYARVYSDGRPLNDQRETLDMQRKALAAAGCNHVFEETLSGAASAGPHELQKAIQMLRNGDTLIITRLDRAASSIGDLCGFVKQLKAKGASLCVLHQPALDATKSTINPLLTILSAVAEFEADVQLEKWRADIKVVRELGLYRGRPRSVDVARIKAMRAAGMRPATIARELGIGRSSVYRALATD